MSSVEEIKAAIDKLTFQEKLELSAWLQGADEGRDAWDQQIDADSQAGKLDHLFAPAKGELIPFPKNELP